jgi:hypothetical protein
MGKLELLGALHFQSDMSFDESPTVIARAFPNGRRSIMVTN